MFIHSGNFVHLALPSADEQIGLRKEERVRTREEVFAWDRGIEFEPDIPVARFESDGFAEHFVAIDDARRLVERERAHEQVSRSKRRRRGH